MGLKDARRQPPTRSGCRATPGPDGIPMEVKIVATPNAPRAIGPYSQAILAGNHLFTSGQIPIDPATGELVQGDITVQTRQVLKNLLAVLNAAGSGPGLVLKTTVFLADMADFSAMNAVYAEVFGAQAPARSTVQVAGLPKGAKVEIEALALAR